MICSLSMGKNGIARNVIAYTFDQAEVVAVVKPQKTHEERIVREL